MSAVLTGTSSIDTRALDGERKADKKRWYCPDCDLYWVQSPECYGCFEPGVLYAPVRGDA